MLRQTVATMMGGMTTGRMYRARQKRLEAQALDVEQQRDGDPQHDVDGHVRQRPPEVEEHLAQEEEVGDAQVVLDDLAVVVEADPGRGAPVRRYLSVKSVNEM